MAHQMNQPMSSMQTEPQFMNQGMDIGTLQPNEPRWDETRASMPPDMGMRQGMTPYNTQQQTWEMPTGQDNWNSEISGSNAGMPIPGMGGTSYGTGPSSAFAQSQRMKNPVDMETTHSPTNSSDAYHASLRSLLARNVGYFIAATFLTGTQRMVTWQGILHTVGSDYIVIYQPDYERYISCDFYALKFVQFHNTKNTPFCASSHTWMAQDT